MANKFLPKKTLVNTASVLAVLVALLMITSTVSAVNFSSDELNTRAETAAGYIPAVDTAVLSKNPLAMPGTESVEVEATPIYGTPIFKTGFEAPWQPDWEGDLSPRHDGAYGDIPTTAKWENTIHNDGTNYYGYPMYWQQDGLYYNEGAYSAGVYYDDDYADGELDQDEYLITPTVTITSESVLAFWTYFGGTELPADDHDYIEISTDNGCTWTTLLDLNHEYPSNHFDEQVGIELFDYIGEDVVIAFHRFWEGPWENSITSWWIDDVEVIEVPDHDVGVTAINEPNGGVMGHTVGPDLPVEVTVANFGLFDEVNVTVNTKIYQYGTAMDIVHEDFAGGIPSGWGTIDQDMDGNTWTGGPGYVYADSDAWGQADDILYSAPVDCSAYANVILEFDHAFDDLGSVAQVYVTLDGGLTYTLVADFSGADFVGVSTIDISAEAGGQPNVQIAFYYYAGYDWDWYIYDFALIYPGGLTLEYDEDVVVDIPLGSFLDVTFPDWSPAGWHTVENVAVDYLVESCTVDIDGGAVIDEVPANDCTSKTPVTLVYPFFHDVGVIDIVEPTDGDAACVNPAVTLYNFGQYDECCYPVDIEIAYVPGLQVIFEEDFEGGALPAGWTNVQYGSATGEWQVYTYGTGYYDPGGEGSYYCAGDSDEEHLAYDVGLFTSSIDLTGYTSATLNLNKRLEDISSNDIGACYIWSGGVLEEVAYETIGTDDGAPVFIDYTFDPSVFTDPSDVQLEFYYSTGGGTWDWSHSIDDITIGVPMTGYTDFTDTYCMAGDHLVAEEMEIEFDEWCPSALLDGISGSFTYEVTSCTHLCYPQDTNPVNDCFTEQFTFEFFHDVAVAEITSPTGASAKDTYLYYGTMTDDNAIGLTSGGTFSWGIRLTPDELGAYAGEAINGVKFHYEHVDALASGVAGIYAAGTSSTPGALIVETTWSSTTPGFLEVDLPSSVSISGTEDLWVIITVDSVAGEYPAGCDPGPHVAGKSAWITLDGSTWEEISDYGFDVNWNLAARIGGGGSPGPGDIYLQPGTYDIEADIENLGVFFEDGMTCFAEISDGYEDNITGLDLEAGQVEGLSFAPWTVATDGTYDLTIELPLAVDDFPSNNIKTLSIGIDSVAPTSTHTITPGAPDGLNGWYVSPVEVHLEATDDFSGVDEIYYKINGGSTQTYAGNFTIGIDGEDIEVEYWAEDIVGNEETPHHTFSLDIDQTAPVITVEAVMVDDGGLFGNAVFNIEADATDATSGVERVEFSIGCDLYYTDYDAPYVWENVEWGGGVEITFVGTAFDYAGNSAFDSAVPESLSETLETGTESTNV